MRAQASATIGGLFVLSLGSGRMVQLRKAMRRNHKAGAGSANRHSPK